VPTRAKVKPRIGVMCDYHAGTLEKFGGDEAHHFLNARYVKAVEASGGRPWLLPASEDPGAAEDYLGAVDGLLLTGCGRHTDPAAYGEKPRFDLELMPPAKQDLELALARGAIRGGVPLLAICGGMQTLNVAMGGTLIQRIGDEVKGALPHLQTTKATRTAHRVAVVSQSRLHAIVACGGLQVNSSHTQAVGRPGKLLSVSATAPDGVIEAIEHDGAAWALGVQWHPEYLYGADPAQARLFTALVTEATRRRGG
jgi:putative glutamine amidotransferase